MTTHKAIREALKALLVIGEWSSDELGVWMVDDPFDTFICEAQDPKEATFIAACNPAAIRALLADLDAKTEALEGWIWARENGASEELAEQYARAALKGTP